MRTFDRSLDIIKNNIAKEYNCIPSPFIKFKDVYPGLERNTYYLITANSSVGKSKFTRFLFLFDAYFTAKELGLPFKCFYFSLEESELMFECNVISYFLYRIKGISIDVKKILSINEKLDLDVLKAIEEIKPYLDEFYSCVELHTSIRNSYGIYKEVRSYAIQNGKFYFKGLLINPLETDLYDKYIPDNQEEVVEIIVDHISLLSIDANSDKRNTMVNFSSNYLIKIRNNFGYSPVIIQQQEVGKEKQEFNRGQSIISKLEPSQDGLGDSKTIIQDVDVCFGLFSPMRFEIPEYRDFNITKLKDRYRCLSVLKCRYGEANKKLHLNFLGNVGHFSELPLAKEINYELYK